jgi:hypothetical protein
MLHHSSYLYISNCFISICIAKSPIYAYLCRRWGFSAVLPFVLHLLNLWTSLKALTRCGDLVDLLRVYFRTEWTSFKYSFVAIGTCTRNKFLWRL